MFFIKHSKSIIKAVALLLLALSFLFLFVPSEAEVKEKIIARPGYNSGARKVLSTETSHMDRTFFEYAERHGGALEYIFASLLVLCALAVIASFFFKPADKIFFAALPLIALILYIVILLSTDTYYSIGRSDPVKISGIYLHTERSVKYSLSLVPAVATGLAMLAQLFNGVFDIINAKKAKAAAEAPSESSESYEPSEPSESSEASENETAEETAAISE